ncbi:hypothetical protein [Eubacterium sp.]
MNDSGIEKNNKLTNFDYIYSKIIIPLIEQVKDGASTEFKRYCNLTTIDYCLVQENCEKFYLKKRDELKKIFYGEQYTYKNRNDDNFCLDLHKIAAIICCGLIRFKVFRYDKEKALEYIKENNIKDTDWLIDNVFINYKLAFHFSMAFIYYKMLFDSKNDKNDNLYNKIENQKGLFLYKKNSEHESFQNSIILDFAKRDIGNRSFDYFMYATVLFQIEEYNKIQFNNNKTGKE